MKKTRLTVLCLTAALLMSTVPSYTAIEAFGSVKVSASKSKDQDYTSLPSGDTLKNDVGFSPKLLDTLSGDFKFDTGSITEAFNKDAKGNVSDYRKGVSFKYVKKQNNVTKSVSLSMEPAVGISYSETSSITEDGDLKLYYSDEYANSVAWQENEISYMLMDVDRQVTKDELIAMAKELIDVK